MIRMNIETYEKAPDPLPENVRMPEPNSTIEIYEGDYIFQGTSGRLEVEGKIIYSWMPSRTVIFFGTLQNGHFGQVYPHFEKGGKIIVKGREVGGGFFKHFRTGGGSPTRIEGYIQREIIFEDVNVSVDKIRFSVPNLRLFRGEGVKRNPLSIPPVLDSRLTFEDGQYKFILDKYSDFKDREKKLKARGGYHLLYNGEIIPKKGNISHSEIKDLLKCFSSFLSFLNGRKTSPLFLKGIKNGEVMWEDYSDYYFVDPYKYVRTWAREYPVNHMEDLWMSFRKLWTNNKEEEEFLHLAVLWYTEANVGRFRETSIMIGQTALELIYNWWIVEKKKMVLGRDSTKLDAANKIRLLISQSDLSDEIPKEFTALQKLKKKNNNLDGAPEIMVYVRNGIVHSDEKKLKNINTNYISILDQTLTVYLWYIEVTLLNILEYKGEYMKALLHE